MCSKFFTGRERPISLLSEVEYLARVSDNLCKKTSNGSCRPSRSVSMTMLDACVVIVYSSFRNCNNEIFDSSPLIMLKAILYCRHWMNWPYRWNCEEQKLCSVAESPLLLLYELMRDEFRWKRCDKPEIWEVQKNFNFQASRGCADYSVCVMFSNGIRRRYSNISNGVMTSVFGIDSVSIGIWWYALAKSNDEKTLHALKLCKISMVSVIG